MEAAVITQAASEGFTSSAWYLFSSAFGAALGGVVTYLVVACLRKRKRKIYAKEYLVYIMEELLRGIDRCKNFIEKNKSGKPSLGRIYTTVWDTYDDIEALTDYIGPNNVKIIIRIHEWFSQVNFNADLGRPGPAGAYADFALKNQKIETKYYELEANLAGKYKNRCRAG